jgi:group I intron endonuclease
MTCRFTIYCHTNRVNGKRYVGQTMYSMEKRWTDHVSAAKTSKNGSRVFARAILKYGAEAFDHQVLEVVSTQEAANAAEPKWISQLTCQVPNGYNLKSGGEQGRHHEETIRRMRVAAARTNPIRSAKIREIWADMPPDQKAARMRKVRSSGAKSDTSRSEKTRAWQIAQAKKRTPEQRREIVLKAWAARRAKYGSVGCAKTREDGGAAARKTWAGRTVDARAEHGRKVRDGIRRSREAKNSRMMRINLLRAT